MPAIQTNVVLLSGGMDSTVALSQAVYEGYDTIALYFDYGQNQTEYRCAMEQCSLHKVTMTRLGLSLDSFAGGRVPGKPEGYRAGRNTVFFALAMAYAERMQARVITMGIIGGFQEYVMADTTPEYHEALQGVLNVATHPPIELWSPLMGMTKGEIILAGIGHGVDFGWTVSCSRPEPPLHRPCGVCIKCREREQGFKEAGMTEAYDTDLNWLKEVQLP